MHKHLYILLLLLPTCVSAQVFTGGDGDGFAVSTVSSQTIPTCEVLGGVVNANATICFGSSTGTLTLSNYTGSVAKWQKRVDSGTWSDIVNTNAIYYEIPGAAGTWEYRAVVQTTDCGEQLSKTAVISVNQLPTATLSGSATICSGSSTDLSVALTGSQPWSITYTNGTTPVNLTNITSSPKIISVSPASTSTYTVTSVTDANTCSNIGIGSAVMTVNSIPSTPVSGTITQPTCLLSTGSIVLNGLPETGSWTLTEYPGEKTIAGSGTSTTISDQSAGSYSYTVTNLSGCISAATPDIVILPAKPGVIPTIRSKWGSLLICSNIGDSITSFKWYTGSDLIPDATNQYYLTNKIAGDYKVETIDINGCKNISNIISIAGSKSLSVYPNPASVSFSLKINEGFEGRAIISIINPAGTKVMEFQTESVSNELLKEIPVSDLDEGIYIVKVMLENKELYYAKLVVTK